MGWAALSPVSSRPVYEGVTEVSVYVGNEFKGIGVGRALLQQLVVESERNGIWTLQASVFPENYASLALHKSCGFRQVGRRERIGKLRGLMARHHPAGKAQQDSWDRLTSKSEYVFQRKIWVEKSSFFDLNVR
jgi:RimJ/RimL family protein N-acetyltransferase